MIAVPSAPRPPDVLTALGCAVVSLGTFFSLPLLEETTGAVPPDPRWPLMALVLLVQAAVLPWARALPVVALLIVSALCLPLSALGPGSPFSLSGAAVAVAVFLAVLVRPVGELAAALIASALLVATAEAVNAVISGTSPLVPALAPAALQGLTLVGVPLLVGLFVTARRATRTAQRGERAALAREQDAVLRAAIEGERTAMARELHDIAAHHLSGIALMSAAIERQIDTDPAGAKGSVREVRAQATSVLADLRRLVGLLRDSGDPERSVETLATVPALVEARRAAGADITLLLREGPDGSLPGTGLGPLAQVVAHRMVQESLSNAAMHAPGASLTVEVDDSAPAQVVLRVANGPAASPARTAGNGFGLQGMHERAELVGGALRHGATADGGWEVRLTLPREHPDAAGSPDREGAR